MRFPALVIGIAVAVVGAEAAASPSIEAGLRELEMLSYDVRSSRLSLAERRALSDEIRASSADAVYARQVDEWVGKAIFRDFAGTFIRRPVVERLFLGLSTFSDSDGNLVYYLPADTDQGARGVPASCAGGAPVRVRSWWSKVPVSICPESYLPDHTFDKVGYCAGQQEPTQVAPARIGCGCGPLLLGCLPPAAVAPKLIEALETGIYDEVVETGAELMLQGRPFDELMTATSTWQSGAVEFLYARREMLRILKEAGWTAASERQLAQILERVDLERPARWVERRGVYAGSGLYLGTPAIQATEPTPRVVVRNTFRNFLCTDFQSVHVDSEALLQAVNADFKNLRGFSVVDTSPMRRTIGCKNCHIPLDNAADMLADLATPLFGSLVRAANPRAPGRLYVGGVDDLRGAAVGMHGFSQLVVAQPEFAKCVVKQTFTYVMNRKPLQRERAALEQWEKDFEASHHQLPALMKAMIRDPIYRDAHR